MVLHEREAYPVFVDREADFNRPEAVRNPEDYKTPGPGIFFRPGGILP